MAQDIQIIQRDQAWYVVSHDSRVGPLDTEQEAQRYVRLLLLAAAAGSETACTEEECLV